MTKPELSSVARYPFRDLTKLVSWLKFSLAAFFVAAAGTALSSWMQIDLLQEVQAATTPVSDARLESNDLREGLSALLYMVFYVTTGVLFLRWAFLAKRNAMDFTTSHMDVSPGWGVAFFFIPIAHLWKPYESMKETFESSRPPVAPGANEDDKDGTASLLGVWWAFWIAAIVVVPIMLRSLGSGDTVDSLLRVSWVSLISNLVVDLPLIALVWAMATKLLKLQTERNAAPPPDPERELPGW